MGTGLREKIYEVFSNDLLREVLWDLPAIHALSGCDSTSVFVGVGKVKLHNTVCNNERFLDAAALLGEEKTVTETLFDILEELYCRLYGFKTQTSINNCRYEILIKKKKMPDPERIPPTSDALRVHIIPCNYQVREWKKSIYDKHIPGNPESFGWEKTDTQLEIKWMTERPAPDEVLEFNTCACKKTNCATNQCQCFTLSLECMDLCTCRSCSNQNEVENQESVDKEIDSDDEIDWEDSDSNANDSDSYSESDLEVDELNKFVLK